MIKYSAADILNYIDTQKYRVCSIYQGFIETPDGHLPVMHFYNQALKGDEAVNKLKSQVAEYLQKYPFRCTLIMATGSAAKDFVRYLYEPTGEVIRSQPMQGTQAAPANDQYINAVIQVEALRGEMRLMMADREKEDLRRELEAAKSGNAKFAVITEVLVEKFAGLFGLIPAAETVPMQGHESEAEALEKAIDYLHEIFGTDGLIKLAELLKNKPEFVQIVKSQIQ